MSGHATRTLEMLRNAERDGDLEEGRAAESAERLVDEGALEPEEAAEVLEPEPHPRVYTDGRGHEEIRRPGREGVDDAAKHHRLLAYAWGILEDPSDRLEVDHILEVPWLNIESNLTTRDPDEHGRRTRAREQERRLDPEAYAETVEEVLA